jgi:hypothetical protein
MEPELFKVFCEEFRREVNRLRIDEGAAAATKRAELDHLGRRIRRIVELITDEDAPVRALKNELVALETRQLALQQELAEVRRRRCSIPISPNSTDSASSTSTKHCTMTLPETKLPSYSARWSRKFAWCPRTANCRSSYVVNWAASWLWLQTAESPAAIRPPGLRSK